MELIKLPPALKTIEENTFNSCANLKNIYFSEGLEKIDAFAFSESGLERAEFPASLRTIAQGAFSHCRYLNIAQFREGLEALGTDEYPANGDRFHGVFLGSVL